MRFNRKRCSNYLGGFFSALLISLILLSVPAFATGSRVNSGDPTVVDGSLEMSGRYIVWSDLRTAPNQLYYRDLEAIGSESRVKASASGQISPSISGSIVVWQENADIWYKNLAGGSAIQLTNNGSSGENYPKSEPVIFGNRVAWSEMRGAQSVICTKLLTDSGNGTRVDAETATSQYKPALSSRYLIWESWYGSTSDLKIIDLTAGTATNFCNASGTQIDADISGNIVAWSDARGTTPKIYWYDLNNGVPVAPSTTGTLLTGTASTQNRPSVSVNRIAWVDTRSSGDTTDNIYMKDIVTGAESAISTDVLDQDYPQLSGDKYAWQTYTQGGTWDPSGYDIKILKSGGGTNVLTADFETGSVVDPASGWQVTTGTGAPAVKWGESSYRRNSGLQSAWMAGTGGDTVNHRYADNIDTSLFRTVDLSGFNTASMSFSYWSTMARVGGNPDTGDNLVVQGYDTTTGESLIGAGTGGVWLSQSTAGWLPATIDLTPAAGHVIRLVFHALTNSADHLAEGAYIDDLSITAATVWPIGQITVSPTTASIAVRGTGDFTANAFDQFGNSVSAASINWSAFGGTVSPTTGAFTTFTAGTAPGASYYARASSGSITSDATITVVPGPLNHIDMVPTSVSLATGSTQAFTAQGQDIDHNNISGLTYNWTTDGGTVLPTTGSSTTFTAQITAATGKRVTVSCGSVSSFAPVIIVPGPLNHIDISPASASIAAGSTQSFTAQGQDINHNNISGLTYDWTTDAGSVSPPSGALTILTAQTTAATGKRITVTSGAKSAYADVTIVPGSGNYIYVTPSSLDIIAGGTQLFSAQLYDVFGNPISGQTYTWTTDGGTVLPTTGASTTFTAQNTIATGKRVTVTSGTYTAYAPVNIIAGPLDHIDILPTSVSLSAGSTQSFTAQGQDINHNNISGLTYDWTTDAGSVSPPSGALTILTAQTTAATGKRITVTSGAKSAYADVTIVPGSGNYIYVTPSSLDIIAGGTQLFSAQLYDVFGNPISGQTYTWTTDGGTVLPTTGASTTFTAQNTIATGKRVTVTSGTYTAYAPVNIIAGPLDHIDILPTSVSLSAGSTQSFTAQGQDINHNNISGLTYDWTTDAGSVSPPSGALTILTAQTTAATGKRVTVNVGAETAYAPVDINAGPIDHIDVSPTSVSIVAGTTQAFIAQGQDIYHNNISGLIYTWTTDGGTVLPTTGASTTFTAQNTIATGKRVTVTSGTYTAYAPVNIIAGALDHIDISPASISLSAGSTQSFTAQGQDINHNNISGLTYDWTTDAGSVSPPSGALTILTAQTAAATGKRVTVTSGAKSAYADVTIVPAALNHLDISPLEVTIPQGSSSSFTVTGQDVYHNNISGLIYSWQAARGIPSPGTGSSTTYTAPPDGTADTLTATSGDTHISAAITLTPVIGAFHHIAISPSALTMTAHSQQTFAGQAFDINNNSLTGASYRWTANIGLMNAGMGFYTAPRKVGTYQVSATGTLGGVTKQSSATVTVTPSDFTHIDITGLGAVVSGKTRDFTILTNDAYHNETSTDWSVTSSLLGTTTPSSGGGTSTVKKVTYTATAPSGTGSITVTASGTVQKDRQIGIIPSADLPNKRFIKALYWVGLERSPEPDTGGVNFWTGLVDAGTDRKAAATAITFSHESHRKIIENMYWELFGRAPDVGGWDYWTGLMDAGVSRRSIKASFYGSAEFTGKASNTAELIDILYYDVLGRDPEPGGRDYWAGMVDSHSITPSQFASMLTYSDEYASNFVTSEYMRVLGRGTEGDPGGVVYWVGIMRAGVPEEALTNELYSSLEFYELFSK